MNSGIYIIRSIAKPDRHYIGSGINLKRREREHLRRLERGTHPNYLLQAHYKKYGKSDLEFTILKSVLPLYLLLWEQHYIDSLKPSFNICRIAGNTLGRPQSEETRRKRGQSIKANAHKRNAPPPIAGFTLITPFSKPLGSSRYAHTYACNACGKHYTHTIKQYALLYNGHCGCAKQTPRGHTFA